jgi:AAA domain, putative AbiEii toxin, Type IV TA system/AAA ATPase domain
MITRMTVENFKALRQVQVDLAPFTVLIGPNDTGKTSFLEAVYAIAESTRSLLPSCFWSPWQSRELIYKQAPDTQVRFTIEVANSRLGNDGHPGGEQRLVYSLAVIFSPGQNCLVSEEQIGPVGSQTSDLPFKNNNRTSVYAGKHGGWSPPAAIRSLIQRVAEGVPPPALARWDVEELAMPSRLPEDRRYPFDPSGYGLSTCIAELKLGRGGHFEALRDAFCTQFPAFQDIIIQRSTVQSIERNQFFQKLHGSQGEGYALVLLRKDGVEVPAGLASGGTLVTLAFLTLIHLPEPRKLLLIEEPENALHPGRLKEIVPLLHQAVTAQNDCQVIITTHSPLLLDHVDPAEVRLFLRNAHDDVEVYNVADVPEIRERLNYLMLGELVYNEGEEELVKEIQHHARTHSG